MKDPTMKEVIEAFLQSKQLIGKILIQCLEDYQLKDIESADNKIFYACREAPQTIMDNIWESIDFLIIKEDEKKE